MKRKYATAADKQKAYRDRKRNAQPRAVTPILAMPQRVTVDPRYGNANYQYICHLNGKPVFAHLVCNGQPIDPATDHPLGRLE